MTSTTSQLHEEGARMEDDLVECEGEGKAMLCVTNSKPFFFGSCRTAGHEFNVFISCSLCCIWDFLYNPLRFFLFFLTTLSQTLLLLSHFLHTFTWHCISQREDAHLCLALFSLSPSLLPPIVSTLYPFLHVVGPDDCWGCVRNGGSLETGVHHFNMAVSMATIGSSKGSHTKDTPLWRRKTGSSRLQNRQR